MSNFVRQFCAVFLFSLAGGLLFLAGSFPAYAQVHESDIVINEIMFNPNTSNDQDGEWFEVANISGSDIDIDGWCIEEGSGTHPIDNDGPLIVPANGYLTLGASSNTGTSGIITHNYVYGNDITLNNTGDTLILHSGACGSSTEQDRVEYDDSSPWPGNNEANSIIFCFGSSDNNQGDQWQLSTVNDYEAGNFGTPGTENNCNNPTVISVSTRSVSSSAPFLLSTLLGLFGIGAVGVGIFGRITD